MIKLFKSDETDFTNDGIEILDDICIESYTEWVDNGKWIFESKFKIDHDKSDKILNECILQLPTEKGLQPFRIKNIDKENKKYIIVTGHHEGFEFNNNFILDTYIEEKSGRAAIAQIQANTVITSRFTLSSDIDIQSSSRMVRKNGMDALIGDDENSFINRWGGHLVLNNHNIAMNSEIGEDRDVLIAAGKNITYFKGTINTEEVVTGICAESYDGILLPENIYYSPLVDNYPEKHIQKIKFDDIKYKYSEHSDGEEGYETLDEVYKALREACDDLFNVSNIDKPKCTIRVNIVELTKTDQYKGDEINERIYQGDTVAIDLQDYGFNVKLKNISNRYNSLKDRYEDITFGESNITGLSLIKDIQSKVDKVTELVGANSWQELLDQSMEEATKLINEGIKDSYVVVKKNEILIMDDPDVNSAINVIRMNKNGIAYSMTGYNGPYTLAMTIDGVINASLIRSGELDAAFMKVGTLQSLDASCWWNLDNGTININNNLTLLKKPDGTKEFKIKLSDGTDLEEKLNTVVTQSEITSTADEIKLSVGETGAYNMIPNSRAEQNLNLWYGGNVFRGTGSANVLLSNRTYFRIENASSNKKKVRSEIIECKASTTYTIAALLHIAAELTLGESVEFCEYTTRDVIGSSEVNLSCTYRTIMTKTTNGWERFVATVKTKSDTVACCLKFVHNGTEDSNADAKAYYTDVLMYEGVLKDSDGNVIARPWSPAPSELYSADMIIDKKGVLQRNNGVNSIGLSNNSLNVYDFEGDDHIAGKYRAYRTTNKVDSSSRCGVALHSRYDDLLVLGYLNNVGQLNEIMVFDSTKAYSGSTVSLFGDISIFDILTFKGTDGSYGGDILSDQSMLRIRANFNSGGKVIIGQSGSLTDNVMEVTRQGLYHQGKISAGTDMTCVNMTVTGTLGVAGTKNRLVETSQGYVGMNAYETSEAFFADIGESQLDENGQCIIVFEDTFLETVNTSVPYQVFLSKYGTGDIWCEERNEKYFVIKGTPNLKFAFEVKCKQKGYEDLRLKIMEVKQ